MSELLEYHDPVADCRGWLCYDGGLHRLAAGGCRMQPGLTGDMIRELAARMTLKQRVLGTSVDGAKCGVDYDPAAPGARAVLDRFLGFLREELLTRFSMGSDLGTRWTELEELAAGHGVPSVKVAIRDAQGLSQEEFAARLALLRERVGGRTLAQRRAGHALAHAVLGAGDQLGRTRISCAIQGFGTLGRAAAHSLAERDVRVVAVADEYGCVRDPAGLDLGALLGSPQGTPVHHVLTEVAAPREAVLDTTCDVLVLAAAENAVGEDRISTMDSQAVVVGANRGLRAEVEKLLQDRGVLVIPDFIGGIGGSASMEALFGASRHPSAPEVLNRIETLMRALIDDLAEKARQTGTTVRDAAVALAGQDRNASSSLPYGHSPYLPGVEQP
jgi:glutamate dehydrogenase (NAD(P)+)